MEVGLHLGILTLIKSHMGLFNSMEGGPLGAALGKLLPGHQVWEGRFLRGGKLRMFSY